MRSSPRRSGIGGKILVALVVVAALLVVADLGFRLWTESWVAGRVRESLGLSDDPDVDLHGFPFTVQFARGSFDRATLAASGVTADGLLLESAEFDLRHVTFSRRELFSGEQGTIRARDGSGRVEVTDDAFSAFVQDNGFPVEVRFLGRQIRVTTSVTFGGESAEASATGRVRVETGVLTFEPGEIEVEGIIQVPASALAFEIPFPELFPGVGVERFRVRQGAAEVQLEITDARIRVQPAPGPTPQRGG